MQKFCVFMQSEMLFMDIYKMVTARNLGGFYAIYRIGKEVKKTCQDTATC